MFTKSNSVWIFAGSVGLIILAIALLPLIERVRTTGSSTDVRARAGSTSTLKFTGILSEIDPSNGLIIVSGLHFEDNPNLDLGLWTVSVPPGFSMTTLTPGKKITITVNAKTFVVTSHSLTATAIK